MVTEDPDDLSFDHERDATTGKAGVENIKMQMPAGFSYILMNQNDSTTLAEGSKQRLNTLVATSIDIGLSALTGTTMSVLASFSAFMALTAF